MSDNKSPLILAFENISGIERRYSNLRCVNFRPGDDRKERGGYSLVFRADDSVTGRPVAIKIMDPDYLSDLYRMDCFRREPQIIGGLQAHQKCLRLVEGHKVFEIDMSMGGQTFRVPVDFFVTEWLDEDIDDYFLRQDRYTAAVKLGIFRQLVLAVKVLHDASVYHRDLKRDNFRVRITEDTLPIIAIDFGTAAKIESPHLRANYGGPVGHSGYAPPEAFAGLGGVRDLGKLGDAYALGAILYELFMPDFFFAETIKNPVFVAALRGALHRVSRESDTTKRLALWKDTVREFARAVQAPSILEAGSNVPRAVRLLVADVYAQLVAFDLAKRLSNFDVVLRRIDGAIKCLTNESAWQKELAKRRALREEKLRKAMQKQARVHGLRERPMSSAN